MATFMHKQEKYEADTEFPTPHRGIDPNHQQHGAAGFEQNGEKLQRRQEEEFELRKELRDHHANDRDGAERFFYAAPSRLSSRRRCFKLTTSRLKIHWLQIVGKLTVSPTGSDCAIR